MRPSLILIFAHSYQESRQYKQLLVLKASFVKISRLRPDGKCYFCNWLFDVGFMVTQILSLPMMTPEFVSNDRREASVLQKWWGCSVEGASWARRCLIPQVSMSFTNQMPKAQIQKTRVQFKVWRLRSHVAWVGRAADGERFEAYPVVRFFTRLTWPCPGVDTRHWVEVCDRQ